MFFFIKLIEVFLMKNRQQKKQNNPPKTRKTETMATEILPNTRKTIFTKLKLIDEKKMKIKK